MAGDEGASDIVQNAAMLKKSRLHGEVTKISDIGYIFSLQIW